MASAAAVAADEARSPIDNDIGEDEGRPGEITSGIYSKDDGLPDVNGDMEEDDDNQDGGEDLFGDDNEAEPEKPARRQLDDEELDSGDDLDREDRVPEEVQEDENEAQQKVTMELEIPRQPIPEPSDGEMYLFKMPTFLAIEPKAWSISDFEPPTTDHHSIAKSSTFSAFTTALTTVRWRHSPSDPSELQSNARINRWSDGSLTLQFASDPKTQYEIDAKAIAPRQRNPLKPTPTSIQAVQKAGRPAAPNEDKLGQEAFTYLARPHEATNTLIVTHKITTNLHVKQSASVHDDAIEQLQASLAAAANASKVNGAGGINLVQIDEDPELAKAKALAAVREAERAKKRREAAIEREAQRSNRALGRSGLTSNRYSGLNVGMLEDDEGEEGMGGRGRPSPNKARGKPRRRRNSEYSEDEDFGRKRFTKEDEYDEEDDFVAPSDEEEVIEDDDDPDDGIVEESLHHRERTPKRDRPPPDEEDDEADAPGEEDDDAGAHMARTKRRRIVDDEDEE